MEIRAHVENRLSLGLSQRAGSPSGGNLKVDWAEPHRDDVKAEIGAAVKRVLRKRDVRAEEFDPLVERIMEQAEALYADWPVAA